jgi:hypothetical protein
MKTKLTPFIIALAFSAATLTVHATDIVWTNTAGGNWSTASNWSPNQVPGAADNAYITNNGTYTVTLNTSVTVTSLQLGGNTGTQTFNHSGGTLTLNGPSVGTANAVYALSGGILKGTGSLTLAGSMNWTGGNINYETGSLIITVSGGLVMSQADKSLYGGALINAGPGSWSGGRIVFWYSAVLSNSVSGTLNVLFDGSLTGGVGTFGNAGTMRKASSLGTSTLENPCVNSGTIEVQTGTLSLLGGGGGSGSFEVQSGATLDFSGGTHTLSPSSIVTGAGTVRCSGNNTTVNANGTWNLTGPHVINAGTEYFNVAGQAGTLTLSGGTLCGSGNLTVTGPMNWTGGYVNYPGSLVVRVGGGVLLSGNGGQLISGGMLINAGAGSCAAGVSVGINNGAVFSNTPSATFDLVGDNQDFWFNINPPGLFVNAGTLRKVSGSGTSSLSLPCSNSGTVEVQSGTLRFDSSYVQTAGLTLLSGGALSCSSTMQLQGGTLAGTSTLTGSVNNSGGILGAGTSPGKLTITGNYTQGTNGAMLVELGGTTLGTGYDQVVVGGSATLAGTLNASLYGGFYPAPNATFTYLTAASRSGTFSSFNYPSNVVGLTNELAATTATIRVINTLPVITPIGDRSGDELAPFNLTAIANDYDTPAQALIWSLGSGPSGLGISSGGAISWMPGEEVGPSTNSVSVRVTDNGTPNLTATNTFLLVINEINVAPFLTLPAHQAVNELTPLSVNASATDSDILTNELTFELVAGPPGLTVSPGGAITWTPTEAQGPGDYPVTVRVTDNNPDAVNEKHLSNTNTFGVTVNEINFAPALAALENCAVNPGQTICCTATATDCDGSANTLTFSLLDTPAGATIDGNTGLFNWRPPVAQANTTNVLQVQAMDDNPSAVNVRHLSDTKSFTVIVNPIEPVVLTPVSLADGKFQMEVSGTVGPDYIIQAATALSDWQNLWTNTPTALPFSFTDTNACSLDNCFYRVLLGP